LVDSGNLQIVQQIRVDGVLRGWLARVGFGHRALESHQPHQPLHPLAIHLNSLLFQRLGHHAASEKRALQVQLVYPAHQCELLGIGLDGL
jgi:hypothetical protein